MPTIGRNNARSQEIEKRNLQAASRKKDPNKITDEELEKLFGAVASKLCGIRSVFQHLMNNLFGELKTNNQIIICSVPIDYNLKLIFKKNKTNIKIEELILDFKNNLIEPHYFGRNLEEFDLRTYYEYNGFPTINPLKVMRTFQKVIYDLNEKYLNQNINRKNINQFIKDIDGLLGLYYINPRIDSSTMGFNGQYEKFKNESNNYYNHKIFRFINEETKYYSNDNGVSKMAGTIFFEYSSPKKYKVTFDFIRDSRGASLSSYAMSLAIFEWKQNGWVLLFTDTRSDNIFNSDEKDLIVDSKNRFIVADKMISHAIKFIRNFENIPVGVKL